MPADSNPGNSIFGRDRRRSRRHLVHTPAYANLSGSAQGTVLELCEILDINEYGACIQASSPMKVNRLLPLCLDLSVTGAKVHVVGHVVWSDPSGRTGIRFPDMSEASRAQLRDWLEANAKHAPKTAAPAPSAEGPVPQPEPHVQSRPTHAVAYTSLVNEWTEIEKEVELCGPDLDPALHLIAQRALTLTWASGTAIALINRRRPSEMICRARAGTDSPEIGARLEAGSGFSGQCVQSGTSVTCDDTESDSRVDPANCRALGIRSMAACPVKRGSEVIGILEVFSSEPAAFWENDITILQKLAGFVANAVRRSRAGLSDAKRPIGSFIFLGPTGVGKTELARALAEFLFDDEKLMIRIDMSEYMEKHSVSRLIGAPPGYVGYEEGGQLTEQVRRHLYSVILFDEIEKAHPDVFNVLLQILEDGRLTDGKGRTVDFRNTVLVMTSNVGSSAISELAGNDPERARKEAMEALRAAFRPEFINRIDEIVIFNPLGKEQLGKIVGLLLKNVEKLLAERQMTLELKPAAQELLLREGYDPAYGARPLRRTIQRLIQDPLALQILEGKVLPGDHVIVDRDGQKDVMRFERKPAKQPAAAARI